MIRTIALFALCWPNILIGWLFAAIVYALWGGKIEWQGLVLVTTLKEGSWPLRSWWRGWAGFCLGHGIMLSPSGRPALNHELEHRTQIRASTVAGFAMGWVATGLAWISPWAVLPLLWLLLPYATYFSGGLVAVLESPTANFYHDNYLERAARDAT